MQQLDSSSSWPSISRRERRTALASLCGRERRETYTRKKKNFPPFSVHLATLLEALENDTTSDVSSISLAQLFHHGMRRAFGGRREERERDGPPSPVDKGHSVCAKAETKPRTNRKRERDTTRHTTDQPQRPMQLLFH